MRTRCVQHTWCVMAENAETRKTEKGKEKVVKETKKSVSSKKEQDDSKILQLLTELKQKMDSSEQKLTDVCKRVVDLETMDYGDYEYDEEYVDQGPVPCSSKRTHEQDPNNNETVDDSRFSSLAKRFKAQELTDKDIDPVLANNVTDLFRKGIEDEQFANMLKDEKLARPANCDGLSVVKCNQLVWDLLSPNARTTDKKLQNIETSVVKSAIVLTKMVDQVAKLEQKLKEKGEDITFIVDDVNDSLALLGHANRQINLTRKDLLKPELKYEYTHLCNHQVPYTNQLFGDDVSKAAKEIEDAAKIGNRMQYGNYRGYSGSFRGGRAGFRGRFRSRPRGIGRGRGYYPGSAGHSGDPKNSARRGGLRTPSRT